jgi:transcriptional regulator with XRE-family HTH domain
MPTIIVEERKVIVKSKRKRVSNYEFIVHRIKELRKAKGWDQQQFSKKIGLSRVSVSNIERGRHKISLEQFERICKVFNCKSSDLLPF